MAGSARMLPLVFLALKVIQVKKQAYNEDITREVLRARQEGINIRGINYYYGPAGPISEEVQTTLATLLNQDEIEQLSPATLTEKGHSHLRDLEKSLKDDRKVLQEIENIIR